MTLFPLLFALFLPAVFSLESAGTSPSSPFAVSSVESASTAAPFTSTVSSLESATTSNPFLSQTAQFPLALSADTEFLLSILDQFSHALEEHAGTLDIILSFENGVFVGRPQYRSPGSSNDSMRLTPRHTPDSASESDHSGEQQDQTKETKNVTYFCGHEGRRGLHIVELVVSGVDIIIAIIAEVKLRKHEGCPPLTDDLYQTFFEHSPKIQFCSKVFTALTIIGASIAGGFSFWSCRDAKGDIISRPTLEKVEFWVIHGLQFLGCLIWICIDAARRWRRRCADYCSRKYNGFAQKFDGFIDSLGQKWFFLYCKQKYNALYNWLTMSRKQRQNLRDRTRTADVILADRNRPDAMLGEPERAGSNHDVRRRNNRSSANV